MIYFELNEISEEENKLLMAEGVHIIESQSIFGDSAIIELLLGPGVPISLFVLSYIINKKKSNDLKKIIIEKEDFSNKSLEEIIYRLEKLKSKLDED